MAAETAPAPVPPRRLVVYYTLLTLAVAAVAIVVLAVVAKPTAEPSISGGYDLVPPGGCLGKQVNLSQSGQFVAIEAVQGDAGGSVRFEDGRLNGTVTCGNGRDAHLQARAGGGTLRGTAGGAPVAGQLKREAPTPGAPKPRAPGSVAADYTVSPRSTCLGNAFTLEGDDPVTVTAGGKARGALRYRSGTLSGRVRC